jgi:hypothetical protein
MNKSTLLIFSLVIVAVAAVIAVAALSAQNGQDDDQTERDPPVPLSEEMEMKIKQDYLDLRTKNDHPDATIDDVQLLSYYGTYSGCEVLMIIDSFYYSYTSEIPYERIDGITIICDGPVLALAWKDGNFYALSKAYEDGLLTKDDIKDISAVHPLNLYELERVSPPAPLSEDIKTKIKQDYLDSCTKIDHPDATVDDVMIYKYYGTYGRCVAVMMTDRFSVYATVICHETIGGIVIDYSDSNRIVIWKDGSFYNLHEAFDSGLLTKGNLREIKAVTIGLFNNL